ncbi:hypothetical protein FR483_n247L [Paramecium bursaria Chlorella virus FR483]|uniref:Uncharacterized protein n247L n=1 Tax=Paramecium bursaria Chlorella virus FR483 TaxID=399781 RepID=A7J6V1_PBCVF|nr:hypothetical protein FR483_n247L [Paramecium bursaria Chlorella virus FR483]ABT15532.1 hypothetical protein FR483_n247L [Paramecium bursaria Chlorella virus FR483]
MQSRPMYSSATGHSSVELWLSTAKERLLKPTSTVSLLCPRDTQQTRLLVLHWVEVVFQLALWFAKWTAMYLICYLRLRQTWISTGLYSQA